jgi:cell division protein FtsB
MQKKYKMTGCARFFIALIIIAPLAYLGASYYNGQDGVQNIKNLLGIGKDSGTTDVYDRTSEDLRSEIIRRDDEIASLKKDIAQLRKENAALKEELDRLKNQGQ